MTPKTKSDIFKLGLYQIIGGVVGILIILYALIGMTQLSILNSLVYIFMLAFYSYSIFCGLLCTKFKESALGHSLINQILQIAGFAVLGFAFSYAAGVYLTVGLDLSNSFEVSFGAGVSQFDLNINREHDRSEIKFNLVAIGLVYWIDVLKKRIKSNLEILKPEHS